MRRHLALCATCELEARWVVGEAAVDEPVAAPPREPTFWTRHAAWGWDLAAAALLALAVLPKLRGPVEAPSGGVLKPAFVVPTLLAEREQNNVFPLGPGDSGVLLVLEAGLPAAAFPVDLEIVDRDGRTVVRQTGVGREYLEEGFRLLVLCPRDRCGAGPYVARIRGSAGTDELSFSFEIVER